MNFENEINQIISNGIKEDIGIGDFSSISCIPQTKKGEVKLLVKEDCKIAGVEMAKKIFTHIDNSTEINILKKDGETVKNGDIVFYAKGNIHTLLKAERLILNCMQRMSAIATKTNKFVQKLSDLKTQILDTRKTTPGIRAIEKWAVKIGGGVNHRFGLYDMIMLKDNHIDFAGGIIKAVEKVKQYLNENQLDLKIEVETRNLNEVEQVLKTTGVHRIMLDNFSYEDLTQAVKMIGNSHQTEASGGINENNIKQYAKCGVDFVSIGAITHSINNVDLSLKAI